MGGRRRRSGGGVAGAHARGIAPVVVLWTWSLLSLIAAGFLAVTRAEVQLARERATRRSTRADRLCHEKEECPLPYMTVSRAIRKVERGQGLLECWT